MRIADGLKGIPLHALPEEAWQTIGSASGGSVDVLKFYKNVPWLYRAVNLRADAVRRLPYMIIDGDEGTPLDEYALGKRLGFPCNVREVLGRWAGHMALFGAAYLHKAKHENSGKLARLQVLQPTSVRPMFDSDTGLLGFERTAGSRTVALPTDDVVYVWLASMEAELGVGTPPALVALNAAGTLRFIQQVAETSFQRGAIKPMLLVVPDGTGEADRERLEGWAKRTLSGIKNAFNITAVREGVKVIELGMALSDLAMPEMTQIQREEIAVALGVPQTLLFSNAANFATASQDYRQFHDTTVVPLAAQLCEALTEQLFSEYGLELQEAHEQLEIYQDDKEAEAYRLQAGVEAGLVSVAEYRERLGLGAWDDGAMRVTLDLLAAVTAAKTPQVMARESAPAPAPTEAVQRAASAADGEGRGGESKSAIGVVVTDVAQSAPPEPPVPATPTVAGDLALWQRKAMKRIEEGKPDKATDFESDVISPVLREAIAGALETATTREDVEAAFAWGVYP